MLKWEEPTDEWEVEGQTGRPQSVCLLIAPMAQLVRAAAAERGRTPSEDTHSLSAFTFYPSGNIKQGWTDIYRPRETQLQEVVSLSLNGLKLIKSAQDFNKKITFQNEKCCG